MSLWRNADFLRLWSAQTISQFGTQITLLALPLAAILVLADVGRGVALASVPAAYAFDALTLGQLYAVGFLTGVLTVFFDVAYQSYLPSLVERRQLADGNSKLEISRSGAGLAGPGLAGGLVELVTAPIPILPDAVSFLVSAVLLGRIRREERFRKPE